MRLWTIGMAMVVVSALFYNCGRQARTGWLPLASQLNAQERELRDFISQHVEKIKPLEREANLANWDASNSGKPEDYDRCKRLEFQLRQIYANPQEFAYLKRTKASGRIGDRRLRRQLDLLYNTYLENQIEAGLLKQIVELSNDISERFNTFRSTLDGTTVTVNDISKILTTEADSGRRERAWRSSKQVGNAVAADLIRLVKLRNQAARGVGFSNYHTMALVTNEQDPAELDRIFGELCVLTNEPFTAAKADLDRVLAERYHIRAVEVMPWHYHDPFFQQVPLVYGGDLDGYYKGVDVKELAARFYAGIGLPVDDVLARSDLYERTGKDQHAFSTDIDREGDVRILCNLKNNQQWMDTVLHELGHAVYSKYHDPSEPYLLRSSAHAFATEGIAMFFARLSNNGAWMKGMMGLSAADTAEIEKVSGKYLRVQQLIFARWAMVMYEFEKQLYANPDQDLNSLWWEMVSKYQRLPRPAGPSDAAWASKPHFTGAPCYYHNYMLGELFASQIHHDIIRNVLSAESDKGVSYVGQKAVGEYLRKKVFGPGALYHWNEMVERATGERLTPKYFVAQFVK